MDPERHQRRLELQDKVAGLNDTSPECLAAVDALMIMNLEDKVAELHKALAGLYDAGHWRCNALLFTREVELWQAAKVALGR